jgi:Pyruvate/2-oxoacid:ferredoxin oxidoreductase gamma subunit
VPRNWYDLGVVLPFLTSGESTFEYSIPDGPISDEEIERQIARGADDLRDNSAMLATFFQPHGFEERESELVAFQKRKAGQHWKQTLR